MNDKEELWKVIGLIYEPVMALKKLHDANPEQFTGYFELWFGDYGVEIKGSAITPYKLKITPDNRWIDCTERELDVNDRMEK